MRDVDVVLASDWVIGSGARLGFAVVLDPEAMPTGEYRWERSPLLVAETPC
ncbi:hypothetical protein FKP32DRAFT_1670527 [Trametes sanguinea]|nr:hypothetical protein FKP32DRAFT_1670527 [Trametes sanguinea]